MNLKEFLMQHIRGWIPEEQQLPQKFRKNLNLPPTSTLKFTKSLLLVYLLTLGFVAFQFLFHFVAYSLDKMGWTGSTYLSFFLAYLPSLFSICAIPVAIFTVVFFTKGGGLKSLRSWNKGKKSYLAPLAIAVGYIFVIITPQGEHFGRPSYYDFYYTYFGLSLMVIGFVSLAISYKTTTSPRKETITSKPKGRKKKILLILFVCLLITIIVGFHINIQRRNQAIYEHYQFLKQGMPRLINDQWTDNVGIDSRYVNYNGVVINSGWYNNYSVTLWVNLHLAGEPTLHREFYLGEIRPQGYETFDVNIEYFGELTDVSGTIYYELKD
jgi:hypothetical protein